MKCTSLPLPPGVVPANGSLISVYEWIDIVLAPQRVRPNRSGHRH